MKKRLAFIVSFALLLLSYGIFAITADPGYKFFVDGKEIFYSKDEAQPRIVSDRFVVPVAQTVEQLGINLNWDKNTGTMIMFKNGIASSHILYSNTAVINGVTKNYDVASMVIDGTTFIPTVILADMIGYDSYWYESSHIVALRPKADAYAYIPAPSVPSSGVKPEIQTVSINKSLIASGEQLTVTITTNAQVQSVNLTDTLGRILATSGQYTASGDNRNFIINYTPYADIVSFVQYRLSPIDLNGLETGAAKSVTVSVVPGYSLVNTKVESSVSNVSNVPISVNSVNFTDKTYSIGNEVIATVRASVSAVKLEIYDSQTRATSTYTDFTDRGAARVFDISVYPSTNGTNTFTATVYDAAGKRASRTFTVNTAYYTSSSGYSNSQSYYYDSSNYHYDDAYGYWDIYGNYHRYSNYSYLNGYNYPGYGYGYGYGYWNGFDYWDLYNYWNVIASNSSLSPKNGYYYWNNGQWIYGGYPYYNHYSWADYYKNGGYFHWNGNYYRNGYYYKNNQWYTGDWWHGASARWGNAITSTNASVGGSGHILTVYTDNNVYRVTLSSDSFGFYEDLIYQSSGGGGGRTFTFYNIPKASGRIWITAYDSNGYAIGGDYYYLY